DVDAPFAVPLQQRCGGAAWAARPVPGEGKRLWLQSAASGAVQVVLMDLIKQLRRNCVRPACSPDVDGRANQGRAAGIGGCARIAVRCPRVCPISKEFGTRCEILSDAVGASVGDGVRDAGIPVPRLGASLLCRAEEARNPQPLREVQDLAGIAVRLA